MAAGVWLSARLTRGSRAIEISNGHPQVNGDGGGHVPGLEEAWDQILSAGTLLYAVAVDDAQTFNNRETRASAGRAAVGMCGRDS